MTGMRSDVTLLGVYGGLEEAAQACRRLVDAGLSPEALSVLSAVPVREGVLPVAEPRLRLQWLAVSAGLLGIFAGIGLTVGTSLAYPIRTGHMSIVPIPPYTIIAYELMMLCAIVATVAGFALAIRRGWRRDLLYDEAIDRGCIGVLVYCPEEDVAATARRSLDTGELVRLRQALGRHL